MVSRFVDIATPSEQSRFVNPGFQGTGLEDAFKTLLGMGWRKEDFAIAGSASLYLHSSTCMQRGYDPLLTRAPGDIDVVVTGDAMRHAMDAGIVTPSHLGKGYLISLPLANGAGSKLDITTQWPTEGGTKNAQELSRLTEHIDGVQVLKTGVVLNLKEQFNRAKDRPDLEACVTNHFRPGNCFAGAPKFKP